MTARKQNHPEGATKLRKRPLRISLRYKLAIPTLIFVSLMLVILFQTTFRTVRSLVMEQTESRLQAVAGTFAEAVKVPLILKNQQVLLAHIDWMAKRKDVLEVRVEEASGTMVGGAQKTQAGLPDSVRDREFIGIKKIGADRYAIAAAIQAHDRILGRVLILFSQEGLEYELRRIFQQRLLVAFVMALVLALLTAGITWLGILPLFNLKRAAQEILAGDLTVRAHVNSFDEIQDVEEAFNEMVSRLAKSLDNLRARTEALEESEEKYRLIVENASDIIFTLGPSGAILLLNKDISGLSRLDLLLKGLPSFLTLHTDDSRAKLEAALAAVRRHKMPMMNLATTHIHHGTQTEIFYLTNLTPVLDHEGNVKLVQGVMRDITELRRIEMMKDSLIRDVAHELKTPTAKFEMAISWFEKEVEKSNEPAKYRQIIDILKNNTHRLTQTISSIMDLSKLESGAQRITKVDLDLNELLKQVCLDLEPICKQKHVELATKLSSAPLYMKGDRDMLYRLFVNLISNSLKFTEIGRITVSSRMDGNHTLVEVHDTGIGIEAEELEKIFERFYQKTASAMGIGVGLTICRDIAGLHQGTIWAESEGLGKGSTFKVKFPLS